MFCPKCGSKDVVDIFCQKCLREEKPLLSGIKDASVEVCAVSGRVRYRGRWIEGDMQERLATIIKEHLVPASDVEIKAVAVDDLEFELKPGVRDLLEVPVRVTGRASKKAKFYDEEYSIPVKVGVTISPPYNKMGTSYFEATLQVRNENDSSKKVLARILAHAQAGVAKQVAVGTGTDYFITAKNAAEKAMHAIQEECGGIVKTSAQLFSRNKQTSKDIYRVTFFIELPVYKKGDVVQGPKGPLLLEETSKKLRFKNLKTGKTAFFEYKDAQWPVLQQHETTVAQRHPAYRVLHPETFSQQRIENPDFISDAERVVVAIDGKRLWLVHDAE